MNLIKKHADTLTIIGTIIGALLWMNTKFNAIEKDMAIMKTVLIMKEMLPRELARGE